MKLTVILLIITFMQVSAETYAQKVSFSKKNSSMKEVIKAIQSQTGYSFIISSDLLRMAAPVNVNLKEAPLKDALDEFFKGQPFDYVINKKTIVVKSKAYKQKKAFIQEIAVSGKITDGNGSSLLGVNVRIKGGQRSAISDINGNYRISLPNSNAILVFSSVGYSTLELKYTNDRIMNAILKEQTISLDETVVIGYGTVNRGDLTGSVGKVNMSDLTTAPIASFDQALAGRIAGVQVTSNEGQPGAEGINIVIRGANSLTQENSPLYVIDGFPIEDPVNSALNPNDIESISILKDASATAIYGARGANGVVVIETKKGVEGRPLFNLSTNYGLQKVTKTMELLDPYEFVKYQLELDPTRSGDRYTTGRDRTLESYKDLQGFDWQDQVFETAPLQNYDISLRGGTSQTKYSLSGSLYDQDGIIINSDYRRYQGRIAFSQVINRKLKTEFNVNYSNNITNGLPPSSGTQSTAFMLYSVWGYRPITGSGLDLTDVFLDPDINELVDFRVNPVISTQNELRRNTNKNLILNANAAYSFNPFLTFRVRGGMNNTNRRIDNYNNSLTRAGSSLVTNTRGVNGSVTYTEINNWVNENTLSYNRSFNRKHGLNALGGFSLSGSKTNRYGVSVQQLPHENLGLSGLNQGTPYGVTSFDTEFMLMSYYGRLIYNYNSKYLFTTTFRADGSSKFPPGNKWGFFPSGAFAWRMEKEDFLKDISFISNAKLRMSYGVTGNNRVSDFAYASTLDMPIAAGYSFDNQSPDRSVIPYVLGNEHLRWESTKQVDLGYDLGLFKNRIELTVDIYQKITDDLLLRANLPYTTGYGSMYKNIGKMRNQGLEFTLNTINFNNKNFSWNSNFNISFNQNKLLALTDGEENILTPIAWGYSAPLYIAKLNHPSSLFYGYVWEGNYQFEDFNQLPNGDYSLKSTVTTNGDPRQNIQPGDIKYKDINGDGVVDEADLTVIGRGLPIHTGGFLNKFTYKGFNLNVFFQWSYGNDIINANRLIFEGGGRVEVNQFASVKDRWTPELPNNTLFRTGGFGPGGSYSSRVIEDGSYMRLKTVSLDYQIPTTIVQKYGLGSFNVAVSGQNLFTWTNYSGMDPEVSTRNSALTPGFDYSAYPRARTLTLSLKASL